MFMGHQSPRGRLRQVEQQMQDLRRKHSRLRLTASEREQLKLPLKHMLLEYGALLLITLGAMAALFFFVMGTISLLK